MAKLAIVYENKQADRFFLSIPENTNHLFNPLKTEQDRSTMLKTRFVRLFLKNPKSPQHRLF